MLPVACLLSLNRGPSRHGVTLIEVLMALIISAIAMFSIALPFVAERSMWGTGQRQTQAQRDAQLALRAVARQVRQSQQYAASGGSLWMQGFCVDPGSGQIISGGFRFQGGPAYSNKFLRFDECTPPSSRPPQPTVLIDGVNSQMTQLNFSPVGTKSLQVTLQVKSGPTGLQQTETLNTTLMSRNR